jgi:beta-glucosidase
VTDWDSISDAVNGHHSFPNLEQASAAGVKHGTQLNLGSSYLHLAGAVSQGLLTEKEVDVAVGKLFEMRFKLGMFDSVQPYQTPREVVGCAEHDAISVGLSRQTMTLLKNDGGLLPLKTDTKILLLGPRAEDGQGQLGNYQSNPPKTVNLRQGIEALGTAVTFLGGNPSDADLTAAVAKVDVVVYVAGITIADEGEEHDRDAIELPAGQTATLKVLKGAGKPVVLVIIGGSCQAIPWEAENINSILMAWYPGQSGGIGVADVLFGRYNPAGRSPLTWYRATADLPDMSDYTLKARTYLHYTGKVLWPFGHGLSYTTFKYSNLQLSGTGDDRKLTLTVQNTGGLAGGDVPQVYVKYPNRPDEPLKALKAYKRVNVEAGASLGVEIPLSAKTFETFDKASGELNVSSGKFQVCVGPSSDEAKLVCPDNLLVTI